MSTPRRLVTYLIFIFIILLIVGLIKDIWQLSHADDRVKQVEEKLAKAKQEKQEFNDKLKYYQSEEFLETQIRDKLQMVKPGETIVVLPEEITNTSDEIKPPKDMKELSNWQKWLKLFW